MMRPKQLRRNQTRRCNDGTSSQDRSLPINQTTIPVRAGARVWNRPGDRSSSDNLTRSQSIPISPTPLAQTRGELTELQGMMTTLIEEIRSQRIANQAIANRLDQAVANRLDQADDARPPKLWTVRHSRDPKRPIQTLRGRKFATTPAAGHDPPKLKLQWTGRNRHWTSTPTKHSDPNPERIDGEAGGAKNTYFTTKPFYPRESNSVCDQDLQSSMVR
ncbi:hypothetical protein DY000_02030481 [Brassica cretica]|uniref:Uncharacterized protein n=1 Tax=Brassica cretica TaxID=69181 RepID=A0ABQ7DKU8_BRACR|nr:hypothetical protein DY000_02030481 [Brassica cretica]